LASTRRIRLPWRTAGCKREQVDLGSLTGELLAVVEQTVQPTQASLWLRPPASPLPALPARSTGPPGWFAV